jgi:DnaJ-class molecular chaperone
MTARAIRFAACRATGNHLAAQNDEPEFEDEEPFPCPECEATGLTGGTPCLNCDGKAYLTSTGEPWEANKQ